MNTNDKYRMDAVQSRGVKSAGNVSEEDFTKDDAEIELRPVTVRLPRATWETLAELAAENGKSQAHIIRLALAKELKDYLSSIRFIDTVQEEEIKKAIIELLERVSEIQNELHRIGVNYNQEVRLKNIEKKYSGKTDVESEDEKRFETYKVKKECQGFSKEDLDSLMTRYEEATKKAGEELCRILV